jgi:hypothetical protein
LNNKKFDLNYKILFSTIDEKIENIDSGYDHVLASSNKNVYSFGNNQLGQLGTNYFGEKELIKLSRVLINSPQQENGYDCGFMVLKNLDFYLKKKNINYKCYDGSDIIELRKKIKKTLDDLVEKKLKIEINDKIEIPKNCEKNKNDSQIELNNKIEVENISLIVAKNEKQKIEINENKIVEKKPNEKDNFIEEVKIIEEKNQKNEILKNCKNKNDYQIELNKIENISILTEALPKNEKDLIVKNEMQKKLNNNENEISIKEKINKNEKIENFEFLNKNISPKNEKNEMGLHINGKELIDEKIERKKHNEINLKENDIGKLF